MLANAHLQYNNVDPIYHMDAGRALIVGRRNPQHPPFLGRECQTRKTRFSRPKSGCKHVDIPPSPAGPLGPLNLPEYWIPSSVSTASRALSLLSCEKCETTRNYSGGREQSSGRARFFASASIQFTSLIHADSSSLIVCNPISSSIQPLCKQASNAIPHPSITYSHPYNSTKRVVFSVLVALFPLSTHSHSPSSPLFTSSALSLASSVCIHLPVSFV